MADPTPNDTPTLSAIPSGLLSADTSAVGSPQSLPPMDPEERTKSINVSLADLTAKGNALYAAKNYEEAAEIFSQATEMQAELNGEMAPENADILFFYGRSLFKVGQSHSDVLGGKAPADTKKSNGAAKPKSKNPRAESSTANATQEERTEGDKITEEGVAIMAQQAGSSSTKEGDKQLHAKKPLFQFTGDENWEESDEEEEEAAEAQEGEEEEDEDDLAVAFEILDLCRLLFEKRLETVLAAPEGADPNSGYGEAPLAHHLKERLAETHDLLAEIMLENEKFPEAIKDCRASLKYKTGLYPPESEIIAEAHFKLSLALEFASVTTTNEEEGDAGTKTVDEGLRAEAASQLEKAIASTKLKLQNKEINLAMIHAPEENEVTRKQIAEVKEIIADMEQRLVDLRKAPMDVNDVLGSDNPMTGILGAALGESADQQKARIEEAKKTATDLSGLVRKKGKTKEGEEEEVKTETTNGKRKADGDPTVEDGAASADNSKKAKTEETA
ncbi:histone H1-binding protein [Xylariomycetidae sp. FL2044]|nr:histone H1-binding protein [Xylariomycetidae sp. FL2044]